MTVLREQNLQFSRTNPDRIYASISAGRRTIDRLAVSTDGGSSWTLLREQGDVFFNFLSQGEYDNTIMVHPFNDDIVYVAGVQMHRYEVTELGDPNSTLFSEADRVDVSTPADRFFGFGDGIGINVNVHVDHHNIKAIIGQGQKFSDYQCKRWWD